MGLLAALAFFLTPFQLIWLSQMLIAGLFALSLNLIMGYGGMVHFGHAAFYGLGAYTLAILVTRYQAPALLAMLLAPFVSAAVAVVVGWFSVRRVRLYFSILTLAFGQLLYVIVFQWYNFTGGDNGIHGIRIPAFLTNSFNFYLFTLFIFSLCYLVLYTLTQSPFVLTLRAIRENAERASFIGVDVRRHQLLTFVIGAFFAGLAGALMAQLNRFVAPEMLFWTTGADPILASLLGGMFSLPGPAIGAAVLTFLHIFITRYTDYWPTVLGILTIMAVLAAPSGLMGLLERFKRSE
jgi:branched-chain amino acid transport system permease protein